MLARSLFAHARSLFGGRSVLLRSLLGPLSVTARSFFGLHLGISWVLLGGDFAAVQEYPDRSNLLGCTAKSFKSPRALKTDADSVTRMLLRILDRMRVRSAFGRTERSLGRSSRTLGHSSVAVRSSFGHCSVLFWSLLGPSSVFTWAFLGFF